MRKILLALLLLTAGCVSTQSVVNRLDKNYVGKNVDQFFIDHGAPAGRFQLNSGDLIWTWDSGRASVYIPATTTITGTNYGGIANYTAMTSGGGSVTLRCVVQLISSTDGTIKSLKISIDTMGWWTTSMCSETL